MSSSGVNVGGDVTFMCYIYDIQYISHITYVTHYVSKEGVWASRGASGKNLPALHNTQGHGLDPWLGRSPGGGNGSPLQCSCLENPRDRGAWRATVHGVTKSQT